MALATQKEHPAFAETQATRSSTSRSATDPRDTIHDDDDGEWQTVLRTKAPPARPGFAQRWVRLTTMGVEDVANVMKKRNEGWEPRMADSMPAGFFAPIVQHSSFGNVIVNGDMILMERSLKTHEKHQRHNAKMATLQASTIERYLSQHAPGGNGYGAAEVEKFERKVSTGRRPKIADD